MARFFNTTGPCNPSNELYWVLHAPRQTGKTTFLMSWMNAINAGEEAVACYVSVERCQEFPRAEDSMPAIYTAIREYSSTFLGPEGVPEVPDIEPASMVSTILRSWSALVAPKPLVVLFDEVDVLQDQAMVSFLRQLRGGFPTRGVGSFPVSVALVGMRDLRDYLVQSKDGVPLNPGTGGTARERDGPDL